MNNDRRDQIKALGEQVSALTAAIGSLRDEVDGIRDDESAYLDGLPENLKQGERAQASEAALASLDDALSAIDSLDTAAIASALSEAADRDVPADTVDATVDPKERQRRRFELLPAWAKAELDRLAQAVESLNVKVAATLPEATDEPGEFVVGGYSDALVGRKLPFERIEVPSFDLELYYDEGREYLSIRSRRGQLAIRPLVSNEVLVRGEPFGS